MPVECLTAPLSPDYLDGFLHSAGRQDRSLWRALGIPAVTPTVRGEEWVKSLRSEYAITISFGLVVVGLMSVRAHWPTASVYQVDVVVQSRTWRLRETAEVFTGFVRDVAEAFPARKLILWALDCETEKLAAAANAGFALEARYDQLSYLNGRFVDRLRYGLILR